MHFTHCVLHITSYTLSFIHCLIHINIYTLLLSHCLLFIDSYALSLTLCIFNITSYSLHLLHGIFSRPKIYADANFCFKPKIFSNQHFFGPKAERVCVWVINFWKSQLSDCRTPNKLCVYCHFLSCLSQLKSISH